MWFSLYKQLNNYEDRLFYGRSAFNKNAITFNPAIANLKQYNLSKKGISANITHYVVKGEVLNHLLGKPQIGSVIFLPEQHKEKWWHGFNSRASAAHRMVQNHSMDSVKSALTEAGY